MIFRKTVMEAQLLFRYTSVWICLQKPNQNQRHWSSSSFDKRPLCVDLQPSTLMCLMFVSQQLQALGCCRRNCRVGSERRLVNPHLLTSSVALHKLPLLLMMRGSGTALYQRFISTDFNADILTWSPSTSYLFYFLEILVLWKWKHRWVESFLLWYRNCSLCDVTKITDTLTGLFRRKKKNLAQVPRCKHGAKPCCFLKIKYFFFRRHGNFSFFFLFSFFIYRGQ